MQIEITESLLTPSSISGSPDEENDGDSERRREPDRLPQWWLFFISLYCIPCAMGTSLFYPIVQPPLVAKIVGESRKHQFQGMLTAIQVHCNCIGQYQKNCTYSTCM